MAEPRSAAEKGLISRRLGEIELGAEIAAEAQAALQVPLPEAYGAFTFGRWSTLILANPSGLDGDTLFRPHVEPARWTPLGAKLSGIQTLVRTCFDTSRLMWARLIIQERGFLVPHRDFLEFGKPTVRLNVPLLTQPGCVHSEGSCVYQMRQGEVWWQAPEVVHAAASLEGKVRVSLCLDFRGDHPDSAVLSHAMAAPTRAPQLVHRPAIDAHFDAAVIALAPLLRRDSFRDIAGLLLRAHFHRQMDISQGFDWLVELARRVDDSRLYERALSYRRYCIEARELGEPFEFATY